MRILERCHILFLNLSPFLIPKNTYKHQQQQIMPFIRQLIGYYFYLIILGENAYFPYFRKFLLAFKLLIKLV